MTFSFNTVSFNTVMTVLTLAIFSVSALAKSASDSTYTADATSLANGMVTMKSNYGVKKTVKKLKKVLTKKGMTIFEHVNHSAGAKKVGKKLRPTEVLIFGNPKAGTPLMQCAPSVAIDLPQKMLVWQDKEGNVWLAYNDPQYLVQRHSITGCEKVIEKITGALKNFAKAATQS